MFFWKNYAACMTVCVLRFCLIFVPACCAFISAKLSQNCARKQWEVFGKYLKKYADLHPKYFYCPTSVKKYLVGHSPYSRIVKCEVKQTRLIACVNWLHQFSKICYFLQHGSIYESEPVNWSTFDSFAYLILGRSPRYIVTIE